MELGSVILLGQSDAVHGILATREAHPDLVVHSFYWDPTCVGMIDYPYRWSHSPFQRWVNTMWSKGFILNLIVRLSSVTQRPHTDKDIPSRHDIPRLSLRSQGQKPDLSFSKVKFFPIQKTILSNAHYPLKLSQLWSPALQSFIFFCFVFNLLLIPAPEIPYILPCLLLL